MKNNKGFTLVEILAVVVILSLLVVIAYPQINNALSASKNSLNNFQKKGLQDASERLILEVLNCDLRSETYNALNMNSTLLCNDMQNRIINHTIETTVQKLVANKYFEDVDGHCTGNIKITTDNNYKVTVNVNDVTC